MGNQIAFWILVVVAITAVIFSIKKRLWGAFGTVVYIAFVCLNVLLGYVIFLAQ